MNRFLDIRLQILSWPSNRGQRSLKVIETGTSETNPPPMISY